MTASFDSTETSVLNEEVEKTHRFVEMEGSGVRFHLLGYEDDDQTVDLVLYCIDSWNQDARPVIERLD